jgi:hypothetical protein
MLRFIKTALGRRGGDPAFFVFAGKHPSAFVILGRSRPRAVAETRG